MPFFRRNAVFLSLCLLLIVALVCALITVSKAKLHLLLCDCHTPAGDIFFKYYTQVGEWVPYVVCVALLFYKAGWAAFTLAGTVVSGLATQILKHIVNAPRPLTYFAQHYPNVRLPLVDGVSMSRFFSFPSGHTTTFFALFFALCIIYTSQSAKRQTAQPSVYRVVGTTVWQVMCFALAALGAYSRIYLSQHFAADILGGICVGLLITGLLYVVFRRWESANWYNWHFFQKKSA